MFNVVNFLPPIVRTCPWPRGLVTSYTPYFRPRGSEPHKDLIDDGLEEWLPHIDHMLGPEGHIDLVDYGPEDWLPHIDHILGPEGQDLM